MQTKELAKKITEDLWWVFKRDSWVIAMSSILIVKYTATISDQDLFNFLEKGCLSYLILIPFPLMTVIILSHICTQGQKRLKPTESRNKVRVLYAAGTIVVIVAHAVTIYVTSVMIFYSTPIVDKEKLEFWYGVEVVYGLIFTPVFDWYFFRRFIPKKFTNEVRNVEETWYCNILNAPKKNLIVSALGFFILVVILEILC
jgi:hypothetical protein